MITDAGGSEDVATAKVPETADQILQQFETELTVARRVFHINVSLGLNVFALDKKNRTDFMRQTDLAMQGQVCRGEFLG